MYRKEDKSQMTIYDFVLPFSGSLDPDNRWVKLADIIPWDDIEEQYASLFADVKKGGETAKPLRMALGALIIKEKCGYSDRETVAQISENPYLQYFIGLKEFRCEEPFDHSLMVHFRKRLDLDKLNEINELICIEVSKQSKKDSNKKQDDDDDEHGPGMGNEETIENQVQKDVETKKQNSGKLMLDATCAPADIRYPTDIALLNDAREKTEAMIDTLYAPLRKEMKKPRTYRQKARKEYLKTAKKRKHKGKHLRKAIRKQLGYVRRNLYTIENLLAKHDNSNILSALQKQQLAVIQKLYEQQKEMYEQKKHSVENRIVSISQPHIRPIVRGKAAANVEFGAKIEISLVNGYAFIEKLSWDNFNEGTRLIESIESYRERFGCYPEVVLADKLYRNRDNLRYCKERGIRLSGPQLGRPAKQQLAKQKKIERVDAAERNAIEGKFGEGKRKYGLNRIMCRLKETSETEIALQFLVMNMERRVRAFLFAIFKKLFMYDKMLAEL